MIWPISVAALEVWSAREEISVATTAKPRPASPALAASMFAFNESRFVWEAISEIISVDALIFITEAFVAFVWAPNSLTAWTVFWLILFRCSKILMAWLLVSFIIWALFSSSMAFSLACETSSPIVTISCSAFKVSSAWLPAPVAISRIACSTRRRYSMVFSELLFSSLEEFCKTWELSEMEPIMLFRLVANVFVLFVITPTSSPRRRFFWFTSTFRLPSARLSSTFTLPCMELEIEYAKMKLVITAMIMTIRIAPRNM